VTKVKRILSRTGGTCRALAWFCVLSIFVACSSGSGGDGPGDLGADTSAPSDEGPVVLEDVMSAVDEGNLPGQPSDCTPLPDFFAQEIWSKFMLSKCIACHNPGGAGKETKFVLQSSGIPGFMEHNLQIASELVAYEKGGVSLLLLKPIGEDNHGGGVVLTEESEDYQALLEFVDRVNNPIDCEPTTTELSGFFQGVEVLNPLETYRRATLLLSQRLPTASELGFLEAGGDASLETLIDDLMVEEGFYTWLMESYNDLILTDRYRPGDQAVNLLNNDDYPDRRWYKKEGPLWMNGDISGYTLQLGKLHANQAVARDGLQLIAHVVRNNRPFTEILTADYMVVNPFSAISYGVQDLVDFDGLNDPTEFREVKLPGIPHAGVLTSTMFHNRFPTTATNRNRHRARMVYYFFLGYDIMKLAERPIDPASIEDHNPTMFNPDCVQCHEVLDPLAGSFQNWDNKGWYRPPEAGWYQEMLPPGHGDEVMPYEERVYAAQWIANRLSTDPRFVSGTVRVLYQALTGQSVVSIPAEDADGYDAKFSSYLVQNNLLMSLGETFVDSNYDIRPVVKAIILSPYFRAEGLAVDIDEQRLVELSELGTSRLSTPEQLNRKIQATVGYAWKTAYNGKSYLTNSEYYSIFYGGIDSDNVVKRIKSPNGFIVSVQERMANDLPCQSVARDFTIPKSNRYLFPYVEVTTEPVDGDGFEIPENVDAIRENIRYLHWHVLGERLAKSDEAIEISYQLFLDTLQEGQEGLDSNELSANLPNSCRASVDWTTQMTLDDATKITTDESYIVRAWMSVLSYLLYDYRFLYQ
jgi:hypothetical protein